MSDPLLARTHALGAGLRVRLRLARLGDEAAVRRLLAGHGVPATALDVRRLLTYRPAERLVLAAVAPIDGTETLVGVGAIDLREDADVDTLVVHERLGGALGGLLGDALRFRARAHARRVA